MHFSYTIYYYQLESPCYSLDGNLFFFLICICVQYCKISRTHKLNHTTGSPLHSECVPGELRGTAAEGLSVGKMLSFPFQTEPNPLMLTFMVSSFFPVIHFFASHFLNNTGVSKHASCCLGGLGRAGVHYKSKEHIVCAAHAFRVHSL